MFLTLNQDQFILFLMTQKGQKNEFFVQVQIDGKETIQVKDVSPASDLKRVLKLLMMIDRLPKTDKLEMFSITDSNNKKFNLSSTVSEFKQGENLYFIRIRNPGAVDSQKMAESDLVKVSELFKIGKYDEAKSFLQKSDAIPRNVAETLIIVSENFDMEKSSIKMTLSKLVLEEEEKQKTLEKKFANEKKALETAHATEKKKLVGQIEAGNNKVLAVKWKLEQAEKSKKPLHQKIEKVEKEIQSYKAKVTQQQMKIKQLEKTVDYQQKDLVQLKKKEGEINEATEKKKIDAFFGNERSVYRFFRSEFRLFQKFSDGIAKALKKVSQKSVDHLELRYSYHPALTSSFHKSVDDKKSILLICITQDDTIVGAFTSEPISIANTPSKEGSAFLFSYRKNQDFRVFMSKANAISAPYDVDHILFGFDDICIQTNTLILRSKLIQRESLAYSIASDRRTFLSDRGQSEVKLKKYEFFEVFFN